MPWKTAIRCRKLKPPGMPERWNNGFFRLERRDAFYFCNGLKMQADRFGCRQIQGLFCVLAQGEIPRFLGLGYVDEMGLLRVKKLFSRLEEKPGRVEDKEGADL